MIDTDKYEGHTEGPWNLTPEGHIVADDMTVVCNKYTKRIVETNHKEEKRNKVCNNSYNIRV